MVQVNLFRKAVGDTEIGGYSVPDGTPLAAEVSVLMIDDEHFKNAEKVQFSNIKYKFQFDPSRYIENPDLEKHVLPFGMGKRACPGESLARAEIYLVSLIH